MYVATQLQRADIEDKMELVRKNKLVSTEWMLNKFRISIIDIRRQMTYSVQSPHKTYGKNMHKRMVNKTRNDQFAKPGNLVFTRESIRIYKPVVCYKTDLY